ncbi:MAG: hypothetical protein A2268_00540 [Candidatus Raymondbacteria bacterium RifOxyA12_full_50_37]|uniref:Oxidoreductase n=1 Tax=Candidatus Raymondbacteria bacterium RIFOXYD12_FULL_49_13 TaxID=1817890 RepID=A0A1F7F2Y0_UNCRA|nr:MAG: hypothetical protein A2350_09025 [Candidatus Raymondbacteria bacterium RifOxyB12_full_50_8]OGJ91471.1 MAG: hypothetical protein A2268_00540 [Candidatus Raymondbacteria bacterium RifOxyA12_full_50_37]OGJ92801.1 MAG: hypothetical protein A2248_04590 [Candidatus Raymondbacteria bacterium RIFOXYA2_FULL_49_16]OGK01001.1 MAG: hypothetical protein A2519_17255 [Candidatus Raymondbacteria bacterium RIFOXYD12_FULL_49_13]OGK03559.1 MAG: hypothetical protein A2487_06755 [Candidatus Raymondbacteria 
MKICIIGASGHYWSTLKAVQADPDASVIGVAPGAPGEEMENLVNHPHLGRTTLYDCYTAMLEKEKPDIVVVNSHFYLNGKIAANTVRRGIHTYTEKPMATTLDDLNDLRKAAQENPKVLLLAMQELRYGPAVIAAKQAIDSGVVGEIVQATAQKSYKIGNRPAFYRKQETYGGIIPWIGTHAIDWIHWYTGKRFISGYASQTRIGNRDHGEMESAATAVLALEGSIPATINLDFCRPVEAPTHGDDRIRIIGSKGVVEVKDNTATLITDTAGPVDLEIGPERNVFREIMDTVREKKSGLLLSTGESFYVSEVCLKLRTSAETGAIVDLR